MKESSELAPRDSQTSSLDKPSESPATPHSYNYGVDPNADNQIHLLDYWRAIRKRLWLVISVVVLVTMLAVVYMARKPDIYQSEARVQVDLENNSALLGKTPYFLGSPNDPVYFNTQLQILTSPGLIRRVVKTLDLEHNPDFLKGQGTKRSTWQTVLKMVGWSSNEKTQPVNQVDELTLSSTAPPTSPDDLKEAKRLAPFVFAIQGGLKVEPVRETRGGFNKETRLISLSFTHTDPQVAAKVVNTVADTFVYQNLQKKNETNADTGSFLQQRIAELQRQIREEEEKLANYAKSHEIISLDANQNTVVERLAGLNRQLLEAENDRKTAESSLNAARAPGAATALVEGGDPKQGGGVDDSKLADLRQKRAQLLVDATEEAPEVKEINQQIRELESQQKETSGRRSSTLLTNLETKYRQALAYEESLRKAFNQQRGETLTQNDAAINYRISQQGIETYKSMLNNLLTRSKENDVVMATKANNISIVDYAIAPDGPVGPNRMRGVMLAMLLSVGLGVGMALFLEYLDDTVHSTEEVERLLHLPALAVIPAIAPAARRRALAANPGSLQKKNGQASNNPELLMNVDGRSPLAEAYRHLRTSVLLSTAGRAPKALLVTSSLPGEGKTTTAVNTALSLAQTGATVVIVDADMRRPRLRSIFGLEAQAGLSSILSSEMTDLEMIALVDHDPVSDLNILTSGPIPPNPAELLGSEQMRRLVAALQAKYSHVVIDSPPIASFTDGVLISTMVDGVLLVVHGGKSSRHVVRRSRQLLQDVGAKIFGVVLNNINLQTHDYYYYQRYYSQNYYKTDPETEEHHAASA
jgi:polysaccharide biosynthesis transport protein